MRRVATVAAVVAASLLSLAGTASAEDVTIYKGTVTRKCTLSEYYHAGVIPGLDTCIVTPRPSWLRYK